MIIPQNRQMAIDLIEEATHAGARQHKACNVIEISTRTFRRWQQQLQQKQGLKDRRKESAATGIPSNKLTQEEREQIIETCNQPEYKGLPPSQTVPMLADKGKYIASESSFYWILKEADQNNRRGRADSPKTVRKPKGYKADGHNQVYSWGITYLASYLKGCFYYLYLIEDIFSRKIVGWEVREQESAAHAAQLIRKTSLAEGIQQDQLVLHSDSGSPMKGATMLATLQKLGVVPSFSRPSVSDDNRGMRSRNPYSESLFRTIKYSPSYPNKPFESIEKAREWAHEFVHWYNNEHRHSGIQFVTPNQRHRGEDKKILENREQPKREIYNSGQVKSETGIWSPKSGLTHQKRSVPKSRHCLRLRDEKSTNFVDKHRN